MRNVLEDLQVDAQEVSGLFERWQVKFHPQPLPVYSFAASLIFAASDVALVFLDELGDVSRCGILHNGREATKKTI